MVNVSNKPVIELRTCYTCNHLQRDLIELENNFVWMISCEEDKENAISFQDMNCENWMVKEPS